MGFNSFAWNCEGLFLGALTPIYMRWPLATSFRLFEILRAYTSSNWQFNKRMMARMDESPPARTTASVMLAYIQCLSMPT